MAAPYDPILFTSLPATDHAGAIFLGLMQYARQHQPRWRIRAGGIPTESEYQIFKQLGLRGAVGYTADPLTQRLLQECKSPMVCISNRQAHPPWPQVISDDRLAGAQAADYLYQLGHRNFILLDTPGLYFSQVRCAGMESALAGKNVRVQRWVPNLSAQAMNEHPQALRRMLRGLHPPVAIFCTLDNQARPILDHAADLGWRIPEQISVIGVGNSTLGCMLDRPYLSSVALDSIQIGHRAGALLADLIAGKPAPKSPILIPPKGVVARETTGVGVADEDVARAVAMLRANLRETLSTATVARRLNVSRRSLELRFKTALGCGPVHFWRRLRMDEVCRQITQTNRPLGDIAAQMGFNNPIRFAITFRNTYGMTATEYRKRHQISPNEHG